jgi:hypothetical protein
LGDARADRRRGAVAAGGTAGRGVDHRDDATSASAGAAKAATTPRPVARESDKRMAARATMSERITALARARIDAMRLSSEEKVGLFYGLVYSNQGSSPLLRITGRVVRIATEADRAKARTLLQDWSPPKGFAL